MDDEIIPVNYDNRKINEEKEKSLKQCIKNIFMKNTMIFFL